MRYHRYREAKPVTVLATFVPDKTPVPRKVRYKDAVGNEYSFVIDRVGRILDSDDEIIYQCFSCFGEYEKTYALVFWKKDIKWAISNKTHFMWEQ